MAPTWFRSLGDLLRPWQLFCSREEKPTIRHISASGRHPLPGLYLDDPENGMFLIAVPRQPNSSTRPAKDHHPLAVPEALFMTESDAKTTWFRSRRKASKMVPRELKPAMSSRKPSSASSSFSTASTMTIPETKFNSRKLGINTEEWMFLQRPMPIKFERHSHRYMFHAEVHNYRTIKTYAWSEERLLSRRVWGLATYFLLDDEVTWVLSRHNGRHVTETTFLWKLDDKDALVKQSAEESKETRAAMKSRRLKFIVGEVSEVMETLAGQMHDQQRIDDAKQYVWLLEYMGLDLRGRVTEEKIKRTVTEEGQGRGDESSK